MKQQKNRKPKKSKLKALSLAALICLLFVVALTIFSNLLIINAAKENIYSDIHSIPANDVGLLLGTVKLTSDNRPNLYFKYRIQAAADLFKSGKIKHILVSGDNHKKGYDEPSDMKNALIELGIPQNCITLDYAGFRTLDSVVRANKIFGLSSFTIISQPFHNYRAVFIAKTCRLNPVAYNAKQVTFSRPARTKFRELLARVKAVLDIYILRKPPKFLGPSEPININ